MKSKTQKRKEAHSRMLKATWENSKACRTGSLTQGEWEHRQKELLA